MQAHQNLSRTVATSATPNLPSAALHTRAFRNGNSQAVRIPAAFAFPSNDTELEIERVGTELRIRPIGRRLDCVMKTFAKFPKSFAVDGRGEQEQAEREPLVF
jgi:antitoxin VapB